MTFEPPPTAVELFNRALELFQAGRIEESVAHLRAAFYENLYVAPVLLGEEIARPTIWYPSAEAEPRAAAEYAARYGHLWKEDPQAMEFLAEIWSDPLVRREVHHFINHSKAILQATDESQRAELMRERRRFSDWRRIQRTQSEMLCRLRAGVLERPRERPRLALVVLAVHDPGASVEFYRQLFGLEPVRTSREARGYAEFELPGVSLGIHGHDRLAEGDPYGLGPPPASLGWGAIFVIRVREFDRYYDNAAAAGVRIVDCDLSAAGRRFFVVKDPSGYLMEIAEEEHRALRSGP